MKQGGWRRHPSGQPGTKGRAHSIGIGRGGRKRKNKNLKEGRGERRALVKSTQRGQKNQPGQEELHGIPSAAASFSSLLPFSKMAAIWPKDDGGDDPSLLILILPSFLPSSSSHLSNHSLSTFFVCSPADLSPSLGRHDSLAQAQVTLPNQPRSHKKRENPSAERDE